MVIVEIAVAAWVGLNVLGLAAGLTVYLVTQSKAPTRAPAPEAAD